jgi:hypothetical protein
MFVGVEIPRLESSVAAAVISLVSRRTTRDTSNVTVLYTIVVLF